MLKIYLKEIFNNAILKMGLEISGEIIIDIPKNPEHGDLSCNLAMQYAKQLGMNPRQLAEKIIANLEYDHQFIERVDIAGPGFINIKFTPKFITSCFAQIANISEDYGKIIQESPKKINVEYVSANPTGLLHLGHGRNAVIGDTVANLYEWTGNEVTREYYFNNAGNQMNNLGKSIFARYMQIIKDPDYPFPDDGYHGLYITDIAQVLATELGESLTAGTEKDYEICRKRGEEWCFEQILNTLKRLKIKQDIFFNEDSLYTDGKIEEVVAEFKAKDLAYEKDGALWLKFTELGLENDRVIVKSSGEPTYRLPDIAYHREKFLRGYDLIVDVFGADHIATVPDVLAGVKALGFDNEKVKVLIHQFVTLTENGEQVKMSKRTGKSYTLDELLDEVGEDVVRFFFIMRGISTHLEFDLSLAKEQSEKNPVFYLQYAHARITSIIDKAEHVADKVIQYELLTHEAEQKLIKEILRFPEIVSTAASKFEPQLLAEYLREVSSAFHVFYHECRILNTENNIMNARMELAKMTKQVIKNGLKILGISAPDRM
jgi:arginyl-tRNA synthetase